MNHWHIWEDLGAEEWVVAVLKEGYSVPFGVHPPLSQSPTPLQATQMVRKRKCSRSGGSCNVAQGGTGSSTPDPGFYSRIFGVQKPNLEWRPVIDLSALNRYIILTPFKMETPVNVLKTIRENDWMISLDLKDASFQIPIHPNSRRYLRFAWKTVRYQF